jgi:2-hydroxychromene-2-carboxylate isomerase
VPFEFNSRFPLRTILPLRVTILDPTVGPRIFHAAWAEGLDVGDPAVLLGIGIDPALIDRAGEAKQALVDNTAEAVRAGIFGAPALVVDGRWLFWGQDRLDQVEAAASGSWSPPA